MSFYEQLLTQENRQASQEPEVTPSQLEEAVEAYTMATAEAFSMFKDVQILQTQEAKFDEQFAAVESMDPETANAVITATVEAYNTFTGGAIVATEEGLKEFAANIKKWAKEFFAKLSVYAKQAFLKGAAMVATNQKAAKEYADALKGFVAKEDAKLKDCHINDAITLGAIDMTKYVKDATPVMPEAIIPSDLKDAGKTIEAVSSVVEGNKSVLNGKDVVVFGFFNGAVQYAELKKVSFGGKDYTIPGMPATMKLDEATFKKVKEDVVINDLAINVKGKLETIVKKDIKKEVADISKAIENASKDALTAIDALDNEADMKVAKELYAAIGTIEFKRGTWAIAALRRGTKLAKALVGMKKTEDK